MTNLTAALRSLPSRTAALRSTWWWTDLLLPFFITRSVWILAAYYAVFNYQPNPTYIDYAKRGYFLSKYFLLDIFSRWDARHYLSIAKDGYSFSGSLGQNMDNIAFFPPLPLPGEGTDLACVWMDGPENTRQPVSFDRPPAFQSAFPGRLCSVVLCGGKTAEDSDSTARRAIGWLMVFPVAFIFSSFYTESLFFFLSIAAFAAASSNRWMWAGLCAGLLSLNSHPGFNRRFYVGIVVHAAA